LLTVSSPPFRLTGGGDVEWLSVDLEDRNETNIFQLFPVCNAFLLSSSQPRQVVLAAGVLGGGNAFSALITAFVMAAKQAPYGAAAEYIANAVQKAMPHAAHYVQQLQLSAPLALAALC
jgi:hypothetical protein